MQEKRSLKTYCHKMDICPIVITGFNVEQYYVCSTCKLEVDEQLYKKYRDKIEKEQLAEHIKNMDYILDLDYE